MSVFISRYIYKNILDITKSSRFLSELPKLNEIEAQCIISCKRRNLNHYKNMSYNNLEEIPLASKGWNHSKSKGDFFTIHPLKQALEEMIPFNLLNLDYRLTQALQELKIDKATEFQAKVITQMNQDRHFLLAAETGCGKTISYLLPIIQNLTGNKSRDLNTPKALIIVPNRELAYQVGEVCQNLSKSVGLNTKIIIGGRTKKLMINPEFDEIDILVGTPGAIGKLTSIGIYKLQKILYTVLDEADTLLDDSFNDRISSIIRKISQSKIILVSATMPKNLPDFLKPIEPNLQQLTSPKLHKPHLGITQKFIKLSRSAKPANLLQIAKNNKLPMIIFTNRNQTCNWLAMFLRENGILCSNINGDMNYAIRIQQWNNFIKGDTKILSSTDVGSRGLDTTQVTHILNYDFPLYPADYLHRIGRIGRLGTSFNSKATNFISGPEEVKLVQQIEMAIRTDRPLSNVDGNITNIVQKKILKAIRQTI